MEKKKQSNLPHIITKHAVQDPEKGLPHTGIEPVSMHTGLPHYIFHGLYKEVEAPQRWDIESQRHRREGHRKEQLQHLSSPAFFSKISLQFLVVPGKKKEKRKTLGIRSGV